MLRTNTSKTGKYVVEEHRKYIIKHELAHAYAGILLGYKLNKIIIFEVNNNTTGYCEMVESLSETHRDLFLTAPYVLLTKLGLARDYDYDEAVKSCVGHKFFDSIDLGRLEESAKKLWRKNLIVGADLI